jgi:hypothetical protein
MAISPYIKSTNGQLEFCDGENIENKHLFLSDYTKLTAKQEYTKTDDLNKMGVQKADLVFMGNL